MVFNEQLKLPNLRTGILLHQQQRLTSLRGHNWSCLCALNHNLQYRPAKLARRQIIRGQHRKILIPCCWVSYANRAPPNLFTALHQDSLSMLAVYCRLDLAEPCLENHYLQQRHYVADVRLRLVVFHWQARCMSSFDCDILFLVKKRESYLLDHLRSKLRSINYEVYGELSRMV